MKILITILMWFLIAALYKNFKADEKIKKQSKDIDRLSSYLKMYETRCKNLEHQVSSMQQNLSYYYYENFQCDSEDIEWITDALKSKMIQSHPDNGGSTETFIKYKNLYDKYSRR